LLYMATANTYRCKLCHTSPLRWNATLEAAAQAFADTCPISVLEASNVYVQSISPTVFEEVFEDMSVMWEAAHEAWYGELTQYDEGNFEHARRFITLEARSQVAVGCAYSMCPAEHEDTESPFYPQGGAVFVCRYRNAEGTWSDDVAHFHGKADRNDESCLNAGGVDPACTAFGAHTPSTEDGPEIWEIQRRYLARI